MKQIIELTRWDTIGLGTAELYIIDLFKTNQIKKHIAKINSVELNNLFLIKKIPLTAKFNQDYYVYLNKHSSTGKRTTLCIDTNNEIDYYINYSNAAFHAMTYEIIIFIINE
jgi:hypothetical protein